MNNTSHIVRNILAEYTGLPQSAITDESNLEYDLGLDSLELADLMMQFENEFGIVIPDQDLQHLETVAKVVAYVEQHQMVH